MAAQCKLKDSNKTMLEVNEYRKLLITWGVMKQLRRVIRRKDLCHLKL